MCRYIQCGVHASLPKQAAEQQAVVQAEGPAAGCPNVWRGRPLHGVVLICSRSANYGMRCWECGLIRHQGEQEQYKDQWNAGRVSFPAATQSNSSSGPIECREGVWVCRGTKTQTCARHSSRHVPNAAVPHSRRAFGMHRVHRGRGNQVLREPLPKV